MPKRLFQTAGTTINEAMHQIEQDAPTRLTVKPPNTSSCKHEMRPTAYRTKNAPDDNVVRGSNAAIRDRQARAVIRAVIAPATGRPGL